MQNEIIMKKELLSIGLSLLAATVEAQPVIQASQFDYGALAAFSYRYSAGQSAVSPGAPGANITWDFSALGSGSNLSYTTASCPGDADCGSFPGANQVVNVATFAKVYYAKSATEMVQIGEKGTSNLLFSDAMKVLQFPISYGQTFSDTYAASGASGSRNGSLTSTIDGYGTLKTPSGTYTNVLRQKIVDNGTAVVGGQSLSQVITQYYWMAPGMHHYLMSLVVTEVTGLPVPATYVVTYTQQGPGTVGIAHTGTGSVNLDIFPNPAGSWLKISTGSVPIAKVSLYNVLGQQVLTQQAGGRNTSMMELNLSGLAPGSYLVRAATEDGMAVGRVLVR